MLEKDLRVLADSELSVSHNDMDLKSSNATEHCVTERWRSHTVLVNHQNTTRQVYSVKKDTDKQGLYLEKSDQDIMKVFEVKLCEEL